MLISLKISIIILTALLGLCIGSFLNVVIYRLPNKMSLAFPRSHCVNCDYQLKWYDNIPILSYIILGGKCRNCKSKISLRYPFVELLNMLLYLISLAVFTDFMFDNPNPDYLMFAISCLAFSVLICVFFCDLDNMEIPDTFQICLLILGIAGLFGGDIPSKIYGLLLGGGFFFLISLIFYLVRKKEGLGFGDVKLMAVLGLLLGLKGTIVCILFSSIIGAVVLSILAFRKGEKDKEYPFATFIAPCAVVALLVGNLVADWYLSLFTIL